MIGVIIGDIIKSRKSDPGLWLKLLKSELNSMGRSPGDWEIFGGDSFELRVGDPAAALLAAIKIKTTIKRIRHLDVRIAIGIGDITYRSRKISECNGSAFVNSGDKLRLLKKEKLKLAVKSEWADFDKTINLCLRLGMIAMDRWSVISAETVALSLSYPEASQEDLGKKLKIKQNAVSNRLARAHFGEIMEINDLYKTLLSSKR